MPLWKTMDHHKKSTEFIVKKSIESSNSGFLLCCLLIISALLYHRSLVLRGSFDISIQRMSEVSIEFQCYDAFTF